MMMAKCRRRCSSPIWSRISGNFWTVEMMIFLPDAMNFRRLTERSAWPTVAPTWAYCLMVSRICRSRMTRSVTTMMESKTGAPSFASPINWWASHRDGVALPAARRVLDEVAPARPVRRRVGEQPPHHVELVVARPHLRAPLPAGLLVLRVDDLRVVLQDVRHALARQHPPPQVVGLDAAGVGRVAGPVVPAPVERQEPRRLPREVGAEPDLALVDREVGHAAAELEQLLARVAVPLVLLDGVGHRLLGQAVLELEREDGQAVDEQPYVERPLRLVPAIAELPDDGEPVPLEALLRLGVAGRRGAVEQVEVVRAVPDAVAQDVDGAALRYLALQPGQELAPRRAVLAERQRLGGVGLRVAQEGGELDPIDAELAVVVVRAAAAPADAAVTRARLRDLPVHRRVAGMAGQRRADEPFEAPLRGVGGYVRLPCSPDGLISTLVSTNRIPVVQCRPTDVVRRFESAAGRADVLEDLVQQPLSAFRFRLPARPMLTVAVRALSNQAIEKATHQRGHRRVELRRPDSGAPIRLVVNRYRDVPHLLASQLQRTTALHLRPAFQCSTSAAPCPPADMPLHSTHGRALVRKWPRATSACPWSNRIRVLDTLDPRVQILDLVLQHRLDLPCLYPRETNPESRLQSRLMQGSRIGSTPVLSCR